MCQLVDQVSLHGPLGGLYHAGGDEVEEKGNAGGRVRILHQVLHRKVYNVHIIKKPFVYSQSK